MSSLPKRCIVDTNIPISANMANRPDSIPEELRECVLTCIECVEHVVENGGLVIDDNGEIFDEYRTGLSLSGQPGVGDRFVKWVHDHQWVATSINRITITRQGESYREFPDHNGLSGFDHSDRKFVAVANAHPDKPPILQATDSKWWGFSSVLDELGISVLFLCPEYVKDKYSRKKAR